MAASTSATLGMPLSLCFFETSERNWVKFRVDDVWYAEMSEDTMDEMASEYTDVLEGAGAPCCCGTAAVALVILGRNRD